MNRQYLFEKTFMKKQRKLYADMLRAMGFYVRYPSADGEAAGFTAQAVFSRFVSYI